MRKEVLYTLKGLYREDFEIEGYRFGGGEKSACIVGAMRGNEMQQLYICSLLINALKELEAHGSITHNHEILVIPSVNKYSMNVGKDSGLLTILILTEHFREMHRAIRQNRLLQHCLRMLKDTITVFSLQVFICRVILFRM